MKGTLSSGAHDAVDRIKPVASKAKVPLVASGAALVGVAGAVAVAASRSGKRHKVLGVSMPKTNGFKGDAGKVTEAVVNAAKHADSFGQRLSKVASTVQEVGETAESAVKKSK